MQPQGTHCLTPKTCTTPFKAKGSLTDCKSSVHMPRAPGEFATVQGERLIDGLPKQRGHAAGAGQNCHAKRTVDCMHSRINKHASLAYSALHLSLLITNIHASLKHPIDVALAHGMTNVHSRGNRLEQPTVVEHHASGARF